MGKQIALAAHAARTHELLELVAAQLAGARGSLIAPPGLAELLSEHVGFPLAVAERPLEELAGEGALELAVVLRGPAEPDALDRLLAVCDRRRVPVATNLATAMLCLDALARRRHVREAV